jgi:hypothetical protein
MRRRQASLWFVMGAGVLRTIREFALRSQSLTTLVTSRVHTNFIYNAHYTFTNDGFRRIKDHSSIQKTRMKLIVEYTHIGTRAINDRIFMTSMLNWSLISKRFSIFYPVSSSFTPIHSILTSASARGSGLQSHLCQSRDNSSIDSSFIPQAGSEHPPSDHPHISTIPSYHSRNHVDLPVSMSPSNLCDREWPLNS